MTPALTPRHAKGIGRLRRFCGVGTVGIALTLSGCSDRKVPRRAVTVKPPAPAVSGRTVKRRSLPPSGGLIIHGPRTGHEIALTFDADMTRGMLVLARQGRRYFDPAIVDELHAAHASATIFMTGLWAREYPSTARALARDPSIEIENHSLDHAAWEPGCYGLPSVTSEGAKRAEVVDAARDLEQIAGARPHYFRFPGGCHSASDVKLVESLGERPVQWDVVSGDPFQPDPVPIERAILSGVRPGSIVVMHIMGAPNAPATAAALRTVLPTLGQRGYRFVKLSELLR
jgi:peptidoglycan/xylan/chitin deacetylase (PgdA/CDA1 family)